MTNLHDHSPGGELVFGGDLSGTTFRLLDLTLYSNDDDEKPDVPANESVHGNWLKARTDEHDEVFIYAPGELVGELQQYEAEQGDVFEVTRCVKSGPGQTDPYEVNVTEVEADQDRP